MKPLVVLPYKDPQGMMTGHLQNILPQLKQTFSKAIISITEDTLDFQRPHIDWILNDDFFQTSLVPAKIPVGDHFRSLYKHAVNACSPEQILHLCFVDRVAFALGNGYRVQFIADVQAVRPEHTPLIFQRSDTAWNTHPQIYRDLESIATRAGEVLFQKSLDFAWCHLAIQAGQLMAILPQIKSHDLSMVGEIILLILDTVKTKDVDWLSWEDPFILSCDPVKLKQERETSKPEMEKRLSYMIPILQLIYQKSRGKLE